MGLWDKFKTSDKLEKEGIVRDFGYCRITLARAGGSNQKYNAIMERISAQHQRAIQNNLLQNDKALALILDAYAEAVVLNWETNTGTEEDPSWVVGIEPPNEDQLLPFNKDNVKMVLKALPELFAELRADATNLQFYRQSLVDGAVKN